MSNVNQTNEPNPDEVEFEFKKIEFERSFGHLAALDSRISIAVGVETLLVGVIILILSSVFENKIPTILFSLIPTSFLLGVSLVLSLVSMIICLYILSKKLDFEFASPNPNNRKEASGWIEKYVKAAKREIDDRHKWWNRSLKFLVISVIIFAFTAALITIQPVSPKEPLKESHRFHFHNRLR